MSEHENDGFYWEPEADYDLRQGGSRYRERQERSTPHVPLPVTGIGTGILPFAGVALLGRPASMLKTDMREYRRLGLYIDARIELRKKLARFWGRGSAAQSIDRSMDEQIRVKALEELE